MRGYIVQIASDPTKADAQATLARVSALASIDVHVLRSGDHEELREGYWVTYAGRWSADPAGRAAAVEVQQRFPNSRLQLLE